MRTLFLRICYLAILLGLCFPAISQYDCGVGSLDSAKYRYGIGQLPECIDALNQCLLNGKNFTVEQKIQGLHILAKCYLALDEDNKTDSVLTELLSLKENFEPDMDDPESLKKKIILIKANIVSSVSKFNEDVRLAPATVIVITHEEILQRGYNDLIDVLKDIPGFDISIYYGQLYANVYQRGYRSNNSDKTLLLIDGVEENDLWSNFADISQQYPLINIKRVEVIYGPASTMYGPNAFSGVINVITKEPSDYLKDNHSFGLRANAGVGTYNTKFVEASAAYKKGIFSFSITGKMYYSDRPDLSSQKLWDYDTSIFDDADIFRYKGVLSSGSGQDYLNANNLPLNHPYYKLKNDTITPTALGVARAKELNKQLPSLDSAGFDYTAFINPAKATYLTAKLNIGDLSFGFITWAKTEGIGTTYTDAIASVSGSEWRPAHFTTYLNYNKRLTSKLRFSLSLNYKVHTVRNGSKITAIKSYSPFGGLRLKDLVNEVPAYWLTTYYYEQSEQYRSEFKFLYSPNKYFYLISGIELRNSQLQGYYLTDTLSPVPENTGTYPYRPGGNIYNVNDIGVYTQGTYRTKKGLGFTAGLRYDHNEIRQDSGLGSQLNPRFVVDYSFKSWVFKAIMSKGIQNVSNYAKFDDVTTVPNPSLTYEMIYNYEIYARKNVSTLLTADADFFYSKVNNVVGTVLTNTIPKNQDIGEYQIKGIQSNLYYKSQNKKWQASLNYTYTDPKQTVNLDTTVNKNDSIDLPMADIAAHKINGVINMVFFKNLNINLRVNYVGSKKAGIGTTVPRNPITSFDDYITGNITIGLQNLIRGSLIQLVCNNVLNKVYYSPGIRAAGGVRVPDEVLQMGRTFYLKFNYEF